nr:uncharacterized protein LOC111128293 isoform X2 [Crassostrea virginica]
MTEALLLENRNNFIVKKLNKKVRFYRSREELQENKTKTHISSQLDPLSELLFKRGYPVLYGSCHKKLYPKGHQKLVEGMNEFMATMEDCRDGFNGCDTRQFQEILNDYCDKKEKEIKDAKALCARLVKAKNSELDQRSQQRKCLQEEVTKLKEENEKIRRNWESEIRQKVTEGVRQRLLQMPMLSSSLGIRKFDRSRENSESTDFSGNSDPVSLSENDPTEDSETKNTGGEDQGFLTDTTDSESEAGYSTGGTTHITTINIYNNNIYSAEAHLYQN